MKTTFESPKQFQEFFQSKYKTNLAEDKEIINESLIEICEFLKIKAKEKFGHYQTGWDQLAAATQADRVAKGYSANEPLLRDGTLKESVEYTITNNSAFVGSKDIIMLYQEKGTTTTGWGKGIPPRPVFALTQIQDGAEGASMFFKTFIKLFSGK